MPVQFQAFTSKRTTWASHLKRDDDAGNALRSIFGDYDEVTLSRGDLKNLAKRPNLSEFVIATIIWGYPRGMRGNHFRNLTCELATLTRLLVDAKSQPIINWYRHYNNIRPISGIGLSTYTKFLNFLSCQVNGYPALILDDRIIRVANQEIFEDLNQFQKLKYENAACSYPEYLKCIYHVATELGVSSEHVEFFLFEFGLNLKTPFANQTEISV